MQQISKKMSDRLVTLDTDNLLAGYRGDTSSPLYTSERDQILKSAIKALSIFNKKDGRDWALRYLKAYYLNTAIAKGASLSIKEAKFKQKHMSHFPPEGEMNMYLPYSPKVFLSLFQHWSDMAPTISAIDNYTYTNQSPYDVDETFTIYEQEWRTELTRDVDLNGSEQVLLKDGDLFLFNLNKSGCRDEGDAMGHCGNGQGMHDQLVLSVRTERPNGRYRPHATIILNNVVKDESGEIVSAKIGEMKGRHNGTIKEEFRSIIAKFIASTPAITGKVAGTYAPEVDLASVDFSDQDVELIVKGNPSYFSPLDIYYKFRDRENPLYLESIKNYVNDDVVSIDIENSLVKYDAQNIDLLMSIFEELKYSNKAFGYATNYLKDCVNFSKVDPFSYTYLTNHSSKILIRDKYKLLHVAAIDGSNSFRSNALFKDAVDGLKKDQSEVVSRIWEAIANIVDEHLTQNRITISSNGVERNINFAHELAELAEHNLKLVSSENEERLVLVGQVGKKEADVYSLMSDFKKVSDSVYKNGVDEVIADKFEACFDDLDDLISKHSILISNSINEISADIQNSAKKSQHGGLPFEQSDIIDSEGSIKLIKLEGTDALNFIANSGRNSIAILQKLNPFLKTETNVLGTWVVGRDLGDGGIVPLGVYPFSSKELGAEDGVRFAKLFGSVRVEKSNAKEVLDVTRIICRNFNMLDSVSNDVSKSYRNFFTSFRLPAGLNCVDTEDSNDFTLFDLCASTSLFTKGMVYRNGITALQLNHEIVSDLALKAEAEYLAMASGALRVPLDELLLLNGVEGAVALDMLPSSNESRSRLIYDACYQLAKDSTEVYGAPLYDKGMGCNIDLISPSWNKAIDNLSCATYEDLKLSFNAHIDTRLEERYKALFDNVDNKDYELTVKKRISEMVSKIIINNDAKPQVANELNDSVALVDNVRHKNTLSVR